jgi:hypothetical protein
VGNILMSPLAEQMRIIQLQLKDQRNLVLSNAEVSINLSASFNERHTALLPPIFSNLRISNLLN